MTRPALVFAGLLLTPARVFPAPPTAPERPRLIVLTDISSLRAGDAEPDDGQSMIRLMLYADEFAIEGLIATSNMGHGQRTRPDLIRQVVDAYERVEPNLRKHDDRYPSATSVRTTIKAGQPVAGPRLPVTRSIGEEKDTEASAWIIGVVDRPDPRPVWVTIWGGSADLAQALWRVRKDRDAANLEHFVSKLRIRSIHDQDSSGPWIREEFPDLFFIRAERCYRGMYRGGDTELVSSRFVEKQIHGHGPLADLYPDYDGGDIWSSQNDFAARLDWCVKPYADANHPPVVHIRGARERAVSAGEEIVLDAGGTFDPDGDRLSFAWSVYPLEGDHAEKVVIEDRASKVARLKLPPGSPGRTIPVLLTVTDAGTPALTRYGRVLLTAPGGGIP